MALIIYHAGGIFFFVFKISCLSHIAHSLMCAGLCWAVLGSIYNLFSYSLGCTCAISGESVCSTRHTFSRIRESTGSDAQVMQQPSSSSSSSSLKFFFFLPFSFLQIGLAIKCCGEGHVVQGVGNTIRALVWLHALDAVFGLVGWQLATELIRQDVRFVASQNAERINHLRWEGKLQ